MAPTPMHNPSLRQEARNQPAPVIPMLHDASILNWLEETGRLLARDPKDDRNYLEEEEEISELMGGDDSGYDDDDDLDDMDLDE